VRPVLQSLLLRLLQLYQVPLVLLHQSAPQMLQAPLAWLLLFSALAAVRLAARSRWVFRPNSGSFTYSLAFSPLSKVQ